MEETKVGGYDIPKNTGILINTYALGRNSAVWSNPNTLQLERFLMGNNDKNDQHVDFNDPNWIIVPFGAGRRGCPGAALGMNVVLLGLARFIVFIFLSFELFYALIFSLTMAIALM
jgi:cytochrome P450